MYDLWSVDDWSWKAKVKLRVEDLKLKKKNNWKGSYDYVLGNCQPNQNKNLNIIKFQLIFRAANDILSSTLGVVDGNYHRRRPLARL